MKKASVQSKLIKELETTPIVQVACQRSGITRQTFYRWAKEDPVFSEKARVAKRLGVDLVNDAAESNLMNGIKEGHVGLTKYWLSHNHDTYKKPFTYREAGASFFETERIKEYHEIRRVLYDLKIGSTKEQVKEAKNESRKFFDAWGKVVKRREKKLRNQNDDRVKGK